MKVCIYLPVPEGAPSDIGPHITLVYSEGATGTPEAWRAAVEAAIPSLPATVTPTGERALFGPERDVPVALLPVEALMPARSVVLDKMAGEGFQAPQTFPDFRPHITVTPDQQLGSDPIVLREVCLKVDGEPVGSWLLGTAEAAVVGLAASAFIVDHYRSALLRLADVLDVNAAGKTADEIVEAALWALVGVVDPDPLVRGRDGKVIEGADAVLLIARWMRERLEAAGFGYQPQYEASPGEAALSTEMAPPPPGRPVPPEHIVGRPMRIARVGDVWDRQSGVHRATATAQDLADAVAYFERSGDQVFIDREHRATDPGGRVLAMWLVEDGQALAVLPAYSTRRPRTCGMCTRGACPDPRHEPFAEWVDRLNGNLLTSPHFAWGDMLDAATRERLGACRLKALALTTTPATAHRDLDEARLSEESLMYEQLYQAIRAAGLPEAVAAELEKKAKAMEGEGADAAGAFAAVMRAIAEASAAASKAEAELAMKQKQEAAAAVAPEAQLSAAEIQRIATEAALRAHQATDAASFDPFALPEDAAFATAVRLGAWAPGQRATFGALHKLGAAATPAVREALLKEHDLRPGRIPVDGSRASTPGDRPAREAQPTEHEALLKELGTGRALAAKIDEMDRTNDPRLRLFA